MIEVYKLMNGLVNSDPAAFFTSAPHEAISLFKKRVNFQNHGRHSSGE